MPQVLCSCVKGYTFHTVGLIPFHIKIRSTLIKRIKDIGQYKVMTMSRNLGALKRLNQLLLIFYSNLVLRIVIILLNNSTVYIFLMSGIALRCSAFQNYSKHHSVGGGSLGFGGSAASFFSALLNEYCTSKQTYKGLVYFTNKELFANSDRTQTPRKLTL